MYLRDTWTLLQLDLQPDLIPLDLGGQNLHIREKTMLPETLDRLGDLISGHTHLVSHRQTRKANQHIIIIILDTRNLNVGNLIFLRCQRIRDHRYLSRSLHLRRVSLLRPCAQGDHPTYQTQHYKFTHRNHRFVYQINCSLVFPNLRSRRW